MFENNFIFDEIPNIQELSFNKSLRGFYEQGINATIRENIQNSLDARITDSGEPTHVTITIGQIRKEEIPGIDQLFEHIESLHGGNQYSKETIEYMKKQKHKIMVPIMTLEDENTKGLFGAHDDPDNLSRSNTYHAYAYKRGMHPQDENIVKEQSRGGSHGIGKIANNAASDIFLMYFANCDKNGSRQLGGNIQLIEHSLGNKTYRSTGYFTNMKSKEFSPINNNHPHPLFKKETRGIKNIIPYLREEFINDKNIKKNIVVSLCDSFFWGFLNQTLKVTLIIKGHNDIEINDHAVQKIIQNEDYYITDVSEMKKQFTPLYIRTLSKKNKHNIKVDSLDDTYNFDLYFDYDQEIARGRVAIVRTIGMKIEDFGITGMKTRPFNGVLIGGSKEDDYLKTLENESHIAISKDNISSIEKKKNATRFINNLAKQISNFVTAAIEEFSPTDGMIDTDNLFFQTEQAFKKDIENSSKIVKISQGKNIRKKNKKEKRKSPILNSVGPKKEPIRTQVRKPRRLQPSDQDINQNEVLILPAEKVNRLLTENTEVISIDLSGIENSEGWTTC